MKGSWICVLALGVCAPNAHALQCFHGSELERVSVAVDTGNRTAVLYVDNDDTRERTDDPSGWLEVGSYGDLNVMRVSRTLMVAGRDFNLEIDMGTTLDECGPLQAKVCHPGKLTATPSERGVVRSSLDRFGMTCEVGGL